MKHWERRFRRTAVAMLSVILLGGSVGISAQASSQDPASNSPQGESGAGKTTVRSVETSEEWSMQRVDINGSENDIHFPEELRVKAVVEEGISQDATGVTVLRIVSGLTQTYTSADLKDVTVQVEKWKIDPTREGCTSANFNASKEGVYFYVPVLPEQDSNGNKLIANTADLPYITVVVGDAVVLLDDADGTDPDPTPPNNTVQTATAHGLWISTETKDDLNNVELVKGRACFKIKEGGTFTVNGQWEEVKDIKGEDVAPNEDPMITIIGASKAPSDPANLPKFTIYFGGSGGVTITPAQKFDLINKPIIQVTGYCEVELVVAVNTTFMCSKEVPAVNVPKGSTMRIRSASGTTFNLDGNISNQGTLNIQGIKGKFEVKGDISNKGDLLLASGDTVKVGGKITNEGTMTLGEKSVIDGSGPFANNGGAELKLGNGSHLKTGEFVNGSNIVVPRSAKVETVGGGNFVNEGKLQLGIDPASDEKEAQGNEQGELIVSGSMENNSQEFLIGKKGRVEIQRSLTNTGKVRVSNWTLPKQGVVASPSKQDGGVLLVGKEGSPEIVNSGRVEVGEGGLLTSNLSGCKFINTGELSLASVEAVDSVPSCLGSNITLQKGVDSATNEAMGEFYLTDITEGMVLRLDDIAYDGNNHYNELFQKCSYKKLYNEEPNKEENPNATWELPAYEGITFQVTPASGWGVDLYNNPDGTGSVNKSIRFSSKGDANGNYYVVYKNVNRRKAPAARGFHMLPATMDINVNVAGKEIPKDHPDYYNEFQWDPEEEEIRMGYVLGENMEIQVKLAIETRVNMQQSQGSALKVTVVNKADKSKYLWDMGRKELNQAEYILPFDSLGLANASIKISTMSNGAPIPAGTYEVSIQYVESALDNVTEIEVDNEKFEVNQNVKNEVKKILEPTDPTELYVLRTFPDIDISRYSKEYTYGDEIANPSIDAATAIVRSYYGNAPLEFEWYKTGDLEQVKAENDEIKQQVQQLWKDGKKDEALALKEKKAEQYVGSEFPTKEFLENNGNYEGIVAGDYVLRVMLGDDYDDSKHSTFSAPGEIYQLIHVNTKLVTLRISMDPGPSKVYGEADQPIEYEAEGLVGDDTLNGQLERARDRENVDSSGSQGEARYDKVGSYLIAPGTINTNLNPNYEIVLASPNYQFQILPKDLNWDTHNLIVAEQDNRYKVYGGLTLRGLEDKDGGYVGVTYDNLTVSEDGKTLEVTNPKVIDIYGNETTKYSSNYNPPRSNTIPIDESIYRLNVTEGSVSLSNTLKEQGHTVKGVTDRMTADIKALRTQKLGYTSDTDYKLYDVKVVLESGEVVENIFQKGGLMVTIPYPEGTSKETHNFVAAHMISSEISGAEAPGVVEKYSGTGGKEPNGSVFYEIKKTDEGLVIKVTGLSPVAVAWAPLNNTPGGNDPDDPNNPSGDNNGGNGSNNGNNGSNNGSNGSNNGSNGSNNGSSGSNNNNNGSNSNGNNSNNTSGTTTTNKNGTTTKTSGVNTGDNAPILFYSASALVALLLLVFIICMVRAKRKEE